MPDILEEGADSRVSHDLRSTYASVFGSLGTFGSERFDDLLSELKSIPVISDQVLATNERSERDQHSDKHSDADDDSSDTRSISSVTVFEVYSDTTASNLPTPCASPAPTDSKDDSSNKRRWVNVRHSPDKSPMMAGLASNHTPSRQILTQKLKSLLVKQECISIPDIKLPSSEHVDPSASESEDNTVIETAPSSPEMASQLIPHEISLKVLMSQHQNSSILAQCTHTLSDQTITCKIPLSLLAPLYLDQPNPADASPSLISVSFDEDEKTASTATAHHVKKDTASTRILNALKRGLISKMNAHLIKLDLEPLQLRDSTATSKKSFFSERKLAYRDEDGDWVRMASDQDLRVALENAHLYHGERASTDKFKLILKLK